MSTAQLPLSDLYGSRAVIVPVLDLLKVTYHVEVESIVAGLYDGSRWLGSFDFLQEAEETVHRYVTKYYKRC